MSWTCVTFDRLSLSLWFYFGYSGSLIFFFRPKWGNPRQSWIVDSTPWIPDSRYPIPAFVSGSWILIPIVSGIQESLGCIPAPKPWIPDFTDSEIQIPSSHGAIFWVMSHNVEPTMCPLDPEIMPSPYYPFMSLSSRLVLKKNACSQVMCPLN